jgi:hypothetical protein
VPLTYEPSRQGWRAIRSPYNLIFFPVLYVLRLLPGIRDINCIIFNMGEFLRKDPALERWAAMRDNTHVYWRPQARRMLPLFIFAVAIPVSLFYGLKWSFVL